MAYNYTGYARKKLLTVTKGDYSHTYNICTGFTSTNGNSRIYASLSNDEFARLSDAEYEQRLNDFLAYVCSLEPGLQADCPELAEGSVVYDVTACPLNAVVNS